MRGSRRPEQKCNSMAISSKFGRQMIIVLAGHTKGIASGAMSVADISSLSKDA